MWLLGFYKFYISLCFGLGIYLFVYKNIWVGILSFFSIRLLWFLFDSGRKRIAIQRNFEKHIHQFKQLNGPYGIRIANKAEKDWNIKKQLTTVFTPNRKELEREIEQLKALEELFKAGLHPQADDYLLHDLKLKYGQYRLDQDNPKTKT